MTPEESIQTGIAELETGIGLAKCQKCGCMESTLNNLSAALPALGTPDAAALRQRVPEYLTKMRPVQYTCLGCDHCYPAVAQNALTVAFPALEQQPDLSCEFRARDEGWPSVVGEYFVLDKAASVAVSTLASVQLAEALARRKPNGLAIVGKTETENIGIDKVIKNIVTSPTLRFLVVAGLDPQGHFPGKTLLALAQNGVDENGRVIGSSGKRPILRNVSTSEIQAFREQAQVIDMVGCESLEEVSARVEELAQQTSSPCGCSQCGGPATVSISSAPKVVATDPDDVVTMDKAGYFVVIPLADQGMINVEHYAYDNTLLRVIEGTNARAIYNAIIREGWVTELSHAAYVGKELAKAEISLRYGLKYVQDGA